MQINKFKYLNSTDLELIEHLERELNFFINDDHIKSHTTMRAYELPDDSKEACNTYRCIAGHMAYRSGIQIYKKNMLVTKRFNKIFGTTCDDNGIYNRIFFENGSDWSSIFGQYEEDTIEMRLASVLEVKENLTRNLTNEVQSDEEPPSYSRS